MFDEFDRRAAEVAARYERTAPTVAAWCDWLASADTDDVRLSDLQFLRRLSDEPPHPNTAANLLYKHQHRLGRDVRGQIGF